MRRLTRTSDLEEKTIIHYASIKGSLEIVRYLVGEGMDTNASGMSRLEFRKVNLTFSSDKFGRTSLHYASRNGHLEIVQYLVEKLFGIDGDGNGNALIRRGDKGSDVNAAGGCNK